MAVGEHSFAICMYKSKTSRLYLAKKRGEKESQCATQSVSFSLSYSACYTVYVVHVV